MNLTKATAPLLCPISQCKIDLDFRPLAHWPKGLPAVAVNGWVLAGFSQDLVFNHVLSKPELKNISDLFHSLHPHLSLMELARLWEKSKKLTWFPFADIAKKSAVLSNFDFEKWAQILLNQPIGFQNWCAEKRLSLDDLMSLPVKASAVNILGSKALQFRILHLSKNEGLEALRLCHELVALNKNVEQLLRSDLDIPASECLPYLRQLKAPSIQKKKGPAAQVRWVQHGNTTGIEVKLFVSQPTNLKKQDILELTHLSAWKKH